jgi:hypothetical protein
MQVNRPIVSRVTPWVDQAGTSPHWAAPELTVCPNSGLFVSERIQGGLSFMSHCASGQAPMVTLFAASRCH